MMHGNILSGKAFTFGTDKTWSAVNTITAPEQTVNAPGVRKGDIVLVLKPTNQDGLHVGGIARVDNDDVLTIKFSNPTGGNITPTALEEWSGLLFRPSKPLFPNAYT